jgi:acyl-CoA thioesterase-1
VTEADALRYVAVGDSYTIGTATREPAERWPDQLVERLARATPAMELVANLGVNGFTSRDVIDRELPRLATLAPGFASLLIGVNDVVQGVAEARYRKNVAQILETLLDRLPPNRLVVVTTPDYTVMPRGADYGDPIEQSAAIRRFNDALTELALERDVAVVDIHGISLEAAADRALVAPDGLHPSGTQYGRWVDRIAPVVERLIRG